MPELRIILLVLGVLFIAGIAGFEWWRSRGSRPMASVTPRDDSPAEAAARSDQKALPDINVVRDSRVSLADSLPVIELASASDSGTRRALGISISDEVAVNLSRENAAPAMSPRGREEPYIGPGEVVSEVRVIEEPVVRGPQLVLAWAPEGERRIVTLRVMPRIEPRFAGRALRQAFGAAGFWHGPLDIFHLPDESGRVILSAAALAQPGTFDPSIMDSQRFSGLNLFAVLPGPIPEHEIFDELVHAARQLAERLDGTLSDQHGEELTPQRIARLRQSPGAAPAARVSGEA